MPRRSERTRCTEKASYRDRWRRGRVRERRRNVDWFSDDPWAEPDVIAFEEHDGGDGYPDFSESASEVDASWQSTEESAAEWNDNFHDDWGPIRPRDGHAP